MSNSVPQKRYADEDVATGLLPFEALAQRLDGAVLVSHSQSGIYPFAAAGLSTKGIKGIVAIEPGACPEADSDLTPYLKLPILVVWGDYVEESPLWGPRFRGCRALKYAVK